MDVFISVYMSVKNGMPYLKDAVESIISQSYQSWELIVVDDGSSDDSLSFLEHIAAKDERVRVVPTKGIGRSRALNRAVGLSKGQLLANLDADDLMHPDRLMIQKIIMDENPDIQVLSSSSILFSIDSPNWSGACVDQGSILNVTEEVFYHNPLSHPSIMMRKKIFKEVGGYDERRVKQVDYELWGRMVKRGGQLHKVNQSLIAKRIHKRQSYENKQRIQYLVSSFMVQRSLIKASRKPLTYFMWPYLRFLYGLMPQVCRVNLVRCVAMLKTR